MKKSFYIYITLVFFVMLQQKTLAQATRTWVSGVGDDANPCSRTAPCKTFAGAISKTAAGGEISVLDPGGYGAVTITKAITIDGRGTMASILGSGTNGININAGSNDVVIIRNLSINGGTATTPGTNGIRYIAGKKVHIEDCTISNFGTNIISVSLATKGLLTLKNVNITSNISTVPGISVTTTADTAFVSLDNVNIQGIGTAINAQAGALVNVFNSFITNNSRGLFAETATSVIRLSNTSVLNNDVNVGSGAGKVFSYGNNQINAPIGGVLSVLSSQ